MTLLRAITASVGAGLLLCVPFAARAQTEITPNLNPAEAPCTPPCGQGFVCKAGACELAQAAPAPAPTAPPEAAPAPATASTPATAPAAPPAPAAVPAPALPSTPPPVSAIPENKPGDENLIPAWIHHSDFVDTRLSFLFADNNLLAKPGETTPNSPGPGIFGGGQTNQFNQFFDNFNTRYTGFETLSNLVLYKKSKSYFHGLSAEAALALTVLVIAEKNGSQSQATAIQDASSYIRLNYVPDSWDQAKEGLSLTAFPLSADRMRLGYAYTISWGGSNIFPNQGNSVPGAKLQLNKNIGGIPVYAYLGAKTTLILNEQIHEQETNYGFLGGVGVDVLPTLRIEANGGYFQKGVNPEPQVLGVPVNARGIAGEVVWHQGEPVGYSVDFSLYKNDPNQYQNFFKPESYPGGVSTTISLEGDFLQQTLADPDNSGGTKTQNATAAALMARVKINHFRFHVLGLYRTLSYLLFNQPGFPPFYDFPNSTTEVPEAFFAVGGDYYFAGAHTTLGIIGGMQKPASFNTNLLGGNNPPGNLEGSRTVVFTDSTTYDILPTGAKPVNVLSIKGTGRLQISDYVAAVGEVYFTRDNNRTTFKDNNEGISEPSFQKPNILGFNLLLQARF